MGSENYLKKRSRGRGGAQVLSRMVLGCLTIAFMTPWI